MKLSFKVLFFLAITLYLSKTEAQTIGKTDEIPAIDSVFEKEMNESGIVGMGAAIIVNGQLLWAKGYGYADKNAQIPFKTNTIMNIASISKTFTGVCLMKAVEDKKLSLDEDINAYLPFKIINPYYPKEKITLRNLATHTSGITDRMPIYDSTYYYGKDSPVQLGQFLKDYFNPEGKFYSKENFLEQKPGTFREYSNIAAGLAGYIIELRTGQKLNEYSKKNIFNPLGMNNTGWFLSEIDLANHTKLYDRQQPDLKIIPIYGSTTYPDGGVRTSVLDLSKFFISLLNDGKYKDTRILKKNSVDEMLRFQFTNTNKPQNVDVAKLNTGIFWATKLSGTRIGHGGTDPGVKTEMLADLSKKVGVILFANTTIKDSEMKHYYNVFFALFKYAESLKNESYGK